jgi:hypothetical protein
MGYIKKYQIFTEEFVMGTETKPATPITTPDIRPRPTRPGITPIETPSEEDAPLAYGTETKPATPITTPDTPTRPRPTRPGITPTEVPSEEDAPLAAAKKVMDRLEKVYTETTKVKKDKIDSHFKNNLNQ